MTSHEETHVSEPSRDRIHDDDHQDDDRRETRIADGHVPDGHVPGGPPGGRRPARRGFRIALLAITATVLVIGAVVAIVAWPKPPSAPTGRAGLEIDEAPKATGPVRVVGADTSLVWVSSEPAAVTVSVRNTGKTAVLARVWWLLARAGDPDPWTDPAAQPPPKAIGIDAGQTKTVRVPINLGLVDPGPYELSFWAHTYDTKSRKWVHSDGRSLLSAIRVAAPSDGLTHIGGTSSDLWIQKVTLPSVWKAGSPATVQVQVANAAQELGSVEVWWFLSPTASRKPWNDRGAVKSQTTSGTADPGDLTDLVIPIQRTPRAGTYRLTVWLHQRTGTTTTPRDGVLVDAPVRVTG